MSKIVVFEVLKTQYYSGCVKKYFSDCMKDSATGDYEMERNTSDYWFLYSTIAVNNKQNFNEIFLVLLSKIQGLKDQLTNHESKIESQELRIRFELSNLINKCKIQILIHIQYADFFDSI